jgi:hypothetical protein
MLNMPEIPLGWPLPKRRNYIAGLRITPSNHKQKLTFQNTEIMLQVYRVPIDLPKYRLANGRTQAAQEEYLATHTDCGADFFTRDGESEEAQHVQHLLLKELLKGSDPETNLIKFFTSNKQDEPLILSDDGYVVNGNRRLCSFRELFYGDRVKFSHFSHVEAMVLPPCDVRDIDELEARLQIQPDIKQQYTWVAKACMLRMRQRQHGYSNETLASLCVMDPKDVGEALDMLAAADEYLKNRNKDKQYHLVQKKEYAFRQMQKARKKLKKPDERDLFTQVCYTLIDGGEIDGRLYSLIPEVAVYLPKIAKELPEHMNVSEPVQERSDTSYDIFGSQESGMSEVAQAVSVGDNHLAVVEVVKDVIQTEKNNERQKKKAGVVLEELSKASAALLAAINCISAESKSTGVEDQIKSIEDSVRRLRKWLASHADNNS